jgi:hypothetical protein
MARSALDLVDRLRSGAERCLHVIVRSPSGREGFAMFGGHRPRHLFSRVYLGARDHRMRLGLHGPAVTSSCRRLLRHYGLVVFCGTTTPPELAGEVLHTPAMVDLEMPVPAVLEGPLARWSRSARADISKLRRDHFEYDVQTGDAWVHEFHRRFHNPSMAERHGTEAYTASERDLRQGARAQGAEFLRIVRDGVWVGGILNRSTPEGYRLQRLGWRSGEQQLLKAGVVSAIYWSSIRRAAELGHGCVHFGQVPPYLEDGLMFFKGKWGARFEPLSCKYGEFHLLVDPSHETCRQFLAAHSLLARGSNGDVIIYSGRRPEEVNVPWTIMAGVSRWYRWLERPDASDAVTRAEVPATLRAWLVEEKLPGTPTPTRVPHLPTQTARPRRQGGAALSDVRLPRLE